MKFADSTKFLVLVASIALVFFQIIVVCDGDEAETPIRRVKETTAGIGNARYEGFDGTGSSQNPSSESVCVRPNVSVESVRFLWPTALYQANVLDELHSAGSATKAMLDDAAEALRNMASKSQSYNDTLPACMHGGFHVHGFLLNGEYERFHNIRDAIQVGTNRNHPIAD